MSVETTTRKSIQSMSASIVEYTFSFRALYSTPTSIKCIRTVAGVDTDMEYVTDIPSPSTASDVLKYKVDINEDGVGGTVTVCWPSSGATITIYRDTTDTQSSDYEDYNQFPANTVESDFDKRTMVTQEIAETLDRSLKLPITSSADSELPTPQGGKILGWNSAGTAITNVDQIVTSTGTTKVLYLSNYADFAAAIAAIGGSEDTLVLDTAGAVNTDTTIPTTLQIIALKNGALTIASNSTLTINGAYEAGLYQVFAGAGTVSFGSESILEVYPEWWGVNGVADDVQIQAAGNSLPNATGGIIRLQDGKTYVLNDVLSWTGKNYFQIEGKATLDGSSLPASSTILTIQGSVTTTNTTLSLSGAKKGTSLTVVSAAGFGAGDMVKITSDEAFSETDGNYLKSELNWVTSTGGSTSIVLATGLKLDYTVTGSTVTITKINHIIEPAIFGVSIIGNIADDSHIGLSINYAKKPLVSEVKITSCCRTGMDFDCCDQGIMKNNTVKNTTNTATGYGYSFSNMTQNSSLLYSYSENHRHGFTTGSYFCVWNCIIEGNKFFHDIGAPGGAGINTHNNGVNLIIKNNVVRDAYIGIGVTNPKNIVSGNIVSEATYSGIYVHGDGLLNTQIVGNQINGLSGINVTLYAGTTQPSIIISNNDILGESIAGAAILQGISCVVDNAIISNNRLRNNSPGMLIQGSNTSIFGNEVSDIRSDTNPYGIYIASTTSNISIKNNHIWSDITSEMTYILVIGASSTDTIIENNDFFDYTQTNPISDAGTRTRFKRNILKGQKQRVAILSLSGATTNGATLFGEASSKVSLDTAAGIVFEINGRKYAKTQTDNLWTIGAAGNTGAGEFRKALLCLNASGTASVIYGTVAASQAAADIPDWQPYNVCPIGFVEIGESWTTTDTLSGAVCIDFIGVID